MPQENHRQGGGPRFAHPVDKAKDFRGTASRLFAYLGGHRVAMDDEAFGRIISAIREAQPDLEIDSHRGEQPLYPVIFSIE